MNNLKGYITIIDWEGVPGCCISGLGEGIFWTKLVFGFNQARGAAALQLPGRPDLIRN